MKGRSYSAIARLGCWAVPAFQVIHTYYLAGFTLLGSVSSGQYYNHNIQYIVVVNHVDRRLVQAATYCGKYSIIVFLFLMPIHDHIISSLLFANICIVVYTVCCMGKLRDLLLGMRVQQTLLCILL